MHYLKSYFLISLILYFCISLQIILWFYIFPFSPAPQIWISFLVYSSLYTNKKSILAMSLIISFLLMPYTIFKGFPLFFSICSYGYIIFYARTSMLASSIKSFFIFSLFGFIIIKIFYSAYSTSSFTFNLGQALNMYNIYISLLTGILSLLFFYIFKKIKLFAEISDYSPSTNKAIGRI
ncbi:MAG: hypothetical protein HAW60_01860 [Bdellovibrionales bacterium]|nr:hypothetical protein [Bdellovibrionales bacterium]